MDDVLLEDSERFGLWVTSEPYGTVLARHYFTIIDDDQSASPRPPVAQDDQVTVTAGTKEVLDVAANDMPGDAALAYERLEIVSDPALGHATVDPSLGAIRYISNTPGNDMFRYRIFDKFGHYSEADVSVNVRPSGQVSFTTGNFVSTMAGSTPALQIVEQRASQTFFDLAEVTNQTIQTVSCLPERWDLYIKSSPQARTVISQKLADAHSGIAKVGMALDVIEALEAGTKIVRAVSDGSVDEKGLRFGGGYLN